MSRVTGYTFFILLFIFAVIYPVPGHYQLFAAPNFNFNFNGTPYVSLFGEICPDDLPFVTRIVTCIQDIVLGTAFDFIFAIYPAVQDAIYALLTLGVILMGVMAAIGALERVGRDLMIFLLKVAAIVYFTANMADILGWVIGALNDLLNIVTQYSIFDAPLKCPPNLNFTFQIGPFNLTIGTTIWERLDCLLDVVIGLNDPTTLSEGMLAFFFHNMVSSATGFTVGIIGLFMMVMLVLAIFRAVNTYLLAYIVIVLLVVLGVLFIPLILFKNTFDYFKKWTRLLMAAVLQPVILFAFLNMLIATFDILLYSGEFSVFRAFAGDQVDDPNFNIHAYMDPFLLLDEEYQYAVVDQNQTQFPTPEEQEVDGVLERIGVYANAAALAVNPNNPAEIPYGIPAHKIDYEAVAGQVDADSAEELEYELLASILLAGLITYIMQTMLSYVPQMAEDLAGGKKESAGIAQVAATEGPIGTNAVGNTIGRSSGAIARSIGGLAGRR